MAEHARRKEPRLGQLKSSEQADRIRWLSQLSEDAERDENVPFSQVSCASQNLRLGVCRLKDDIGQKVAEVAVRRVYERRGFHVYGSHTNAMHGVVIQER